MKVVRCIPLIIGWLLLGCSVIIFYAATGLGWLGESVMQMAFTAEE
jgi:hypothetical protein